MENHRTIKALVFDCVRRNQGNVDYRELTKDVLREFPGSQWKESHWAWYRYQITKGRFSNEFSDLIKKNLSSRQYPDRAAPIAAPPKAGGPDAESGVSAGRAAAAEPDAGGQAPVGEPPGTRARDPEVKRIGDQILNHVRFIIETAAGDDPDLKFKLNRWVFARLLQDEIRIKRPIKQASWDSGMRSCQACGARFESLKNVELHRKIQGRGYAIENCELLCRECHQQLS